MKKQNITVVVYETDLENTNLKHLKDSLEKYGYTYTILTDKTWKGFGAKIQGVTKFLKTLEPNDVVIVCDARDVLCTNFTSKQFLRKIQKYTNKHKVVVSTEIGCCVPFKFIPGDYRDSNGDVKHRSYDTNKEPNARQKAWNAWTQMFDQRAPKQYKQSKTHKNIHLNAGMYSGKVGDILNIYAHMNINKKEDDQVLMSEVFFHQPHLFSLDYGRQFFSNSHAWESKNTDFVSDDVGCYYVKRNDFIIDTFTHSKPFFIQTPGKHFKCFDVIRHLMK